MKNYYCILGVDCDASQAKIKDAYRERVKNVHPDHSGESSERFLDVKEAYDVLRDPEKRRCYDRSIGQREGMRADPGSEPSIRRGRPPVEPLFSRGRPAVDPRSNRRRPPVEPLDSREYPEMEPPSSRTGPPVIPTDDPDNAFSEPAKTIPADPFAPFHQWIRRSLDHGFPGLISDLFDDF